VPLLLRTFTKRACVSRKVVVKGSVPKEEVIANGLQLLVDLEGDHDHGVADDGDEGERPGSDGDHHDHGEAVAALGGPGLGGGVHQVVQEGHRRRGAGGHERRHEGGRDESGAVGRGGRGGGRRRGPRPRPRGQGHAASSAARAPPAPAEDARPTRHSPSARTLHAETHKTHFQITQFLLFSLSSAMLSIKFESVRVSLMNIH